MSGYWGTKTALKKCGLYCESACDIFDIANYIEMPNGIIVKTKEELEDYCSSNFLDYDKIYNELMIGVFCAYIKE